MTKAVAFLFTTVVFVAAACGASDHPPSSNSPKATGSAKLDLAQVCEQVRAVMPESPSKQQFDEGVETLTRIAANAKPEEAHILALVALDEAKEAKEKADKQYAGKAPGGADRFRADGYRAVMKTALDFCGEDGSGMG